MPQISPAEFSGLGLRVNTLLAGVPLHDVWAVDLPPVREGATLDDVLRRARSSTLRSGDRKLGRGASAARALLRLRFFLGRLFRLDGESNEGAVTSFAGRLTDDDRARSSVPAGTREGHFRVVYRFENEQLVELHNRTVHAAALSALARTPGGYRYYFAIYVERVGWITPLYMALIDPFRRWIVYPALLKDIRAAWLLIDPPKDPAVARGT